MAITGLKVSKRLEDFISFYDEAINTYKYAYDMVNQCDKLKCDLLHKIELGLYEDINEEKRIQTQLKYCLKDRRYYKDRVEELEPIVIFFADPQNKKVLDKLKQILGQVRKSETYHQDRHYIPRVLKDGGKNEV